MFGSIRYGLRRARWLAAHEAGDPVWCWLLLATGSTYLYLRVCTCVLNQARVCRLAAGHGADEYTYNTRVGLFLAVYWLYTCTESNSSELFYFLIRLADEGLSDEGLDVNNIRCWVHEKQC